MFLDLFPRLFSGSKNDKYLAALRKSLEKKQWKRFSHGLSQAVKMARNKFESGSVSPTIRSGWTVFAKKIALFERQRKQLASGFAFSFVEGALVKALRKGDWVLLDEINLASSETLQRLNSLLDGKDGSVLLAERGDVDMVCYVHTRGPLFNRLPTVSFL